MNKAQNMCKIFFNTNKYQKILKNAKKYQKIPKTLTGNFKKSQKIKDFFFLLNRISVISVIILKFSVLLCIRFFWYSIVLKIWYSIFLVFNIFENFRIQIFGIAGSPTSVFPGIFSILESRSPP